MATASLKNVVHSSNYRKNPNQFRFTKSFGFVSIGKAYGITKQVINNKKSEPKGVQN